MDGFLSRGWVVTDLTKLTEDIAGSFNGPSSIHVEDVKAALANLIEKFEYVANLDINQVAADVVNEMGTNKKIQAIRAVRERTHAGLREAKLAVEEALRNELRKQIAELQLRVVDLDVLQRRLADLEA